MMHRPKISIERPTLHRRKIDERIPHTFADNRPCLFKNEWSTDMLIATSIVPWLMEWLFFYESWMFTGVWQGGGHEEDPDESIQQAA